MTARSLPEGWTDLPRGLRDAVLERLVARRLAGAPAAAPALVRADRSAPVPVSLEQAFFLDRQRRFGGRLAWTIAAPPIMLDSVDVAAVTRAVTILARRHDVLHTRFRAADGGHVQVLDPAAPPPLTLTTLPLTAALAGAEGWVRRRYEAMLAEPFDPQTGPLWRVELVSRAGRGVILMTFCSLIVDGDSLHLIDAELRALIADPAGAEPAPPAADYADYAASQHRALADGRFEGPLAVWRRRLAGGPPAVWADGRPALGPARLHEQLLSADTGRALDAYASARRTTAPVVLLTEFLRLLKRLDGSDDVWAAAATASRTLPGTQAMVGTFARQVPLRLSLAGEEDPLAAVHAGLAEAMDVEPVPHLLIQAMLDADHPGAPGAFRYLFNHRHVGDGSEPGEARDVAYRPGPKAATAEREEDILFMVLQSGERRQLHWYLRTDRFPDGLPERLLPDYLAALRRRIGA